MGQVAKEVKGNVEEEEEEAVTGPLSQRLLQQVSQAEGIAEASPRTLCNSTHRENVVFLNPAMSEIVYVLIVCQGDGGLLHQHHSLGKSIDAATEAGDCH